MQMLDRVNNKDVMNVEGELPRTNGQTHGIQEPALYAADHKMR